MSKKNGLRYPCRSCGESVRHDPPSGDHVLDNGAMLYCPKCGGDTIVTFATPSTHNDLEQLRVLYADRERDLEHEYQRAEAAEAQIDKLRDAFLALPEWDDTGWCMWCGGVNKHAPDCSRQLALF